METGQKDRTVTDRTLGVVWGEKSEMLTRMACRPASGNGNREPEGPRELITPVFCTVGAAPMMPSAIMAQEIALAHAA